MSKKKETGGVDFNGLSRHGYCSGPSVMTILPQESNWSWSNGRDRDDKEVALESYEECERTRVAVTEEKLIGEQNAQPNSLSSEKDKKSESLTKGEAEEGSVQASRGKNYVEEEKRFLRGSGVYSVFDT
jgi:hypothetical protein